MYLYEKINAYMQRRVNFVTEVIIRNNSIEKWNITDKPQPTQQQLDAITTSFIPVNPNQNLIDQVNVIIATASPFQKLAYSNVLSEITNAVNANNWTLLTALANDTTVPLDLQSIQNQLKALLPTGA
jgi:hypothetical protein